MKIKFLHIFFKELNEIMEFKKKYFFNQILKLF
jgi:hypothetical protein